MTETVPKKVARELYRLLCDATELLQIYDGGADLDLKRRDQIVDDAEDALRTHARLLGFLRSDICGPAKSRRSSTHATHTGTAEVAT